MNPTAASLPIPIPRGNAGGVAPAANPAGALDTPAATAGGPGTNANEFARLLARSQDAAASTQRQAAWQAERPTAPAPAPAAPAAAAAAAPTPPNAPAPAAPRAAGERPPAGDAAASATGDTDAPAADTADEAEAPTSTPGTQRPAARARPAQASAADRRLAGREPAGGAASAAAAPADETATSTDEASAADTKAAVDERTPLPAAVATPATPTLPAPPPSASTAAAPTAPTANTPAATPAAAAALAGARATAPDWPPAMPAASGAAAPGVAGDPAAVAPEASTTERTTPGTLASVRGAPLGAADRAGPDTPGRAADASISPAASFDSVLAAAAADIGAATPKPLDAPMPAGAGFAGALSAAGANAPRTGEVARAEPTPVSVPTPPTDPGFQQAIGVQVSLLARDGIQQAELRLNPADMGPVSVQITMTGDQARVDFGADLAQTRQALEAGWAELAASLQEAGFTLSGGGVSQHAAPRERSMPQRSAGRSIEAVVEVDSGEEPVVAGPGMVRPLAGAALDLYA